MKTKMEPQQQHKSWNDIVEDEQQQSGEEQLEQQLDQLDLTKQSVPLLLSKDDTVFRRDSGVGTPDSTDGSGSKVKTRMPSTSSSVGKKNRSDSGCSYSTADETAAVVKPVNKVGMNNNNNNSDSGNGSTETDDGIRYSYQFYIPSHLCGILIGAKGSSVKQLRSATKCDVTLVCPQSNIDSSLQVCIVEGTRSAIDRCLYLIREKFPLDQYPMMSLDQINRPVSTGGSCDEQPTGPTLSSLVPGEATDVYVSAIVSAGHIFVQQPNLPTFSALGRLETCMLNVYERLKSTVPQVPREIIDAGLVCAAKFDNKWYRVQIVSYDSSSDSCDVKFLDYGGYSTVYANDLWQIRSDFLTLPFQAVECYLANVVPPNGSEWPFESGVHLEQLIQKQNCTCRMIGVAEDFVPMVHLFASPAEEEQEQQSETRLLNKELVELGAALWVEHTSIC